MRCGINTVSRGGSRGDPIFGKVNFIFKNCIQCLKIFSKLNFDFIVAEIRVFRSVGCIRVFV